MPVTHAKTDNIPDPTQADLDAQIALGNYPPGTLLADIVLGSDWNDDHVVSVSVSEIDATGTPSAATFLRGDGSWQSPSGSGDVVGPASSTDNAITRYDGTTGKLIQNSGATIDDSGNLTANNISGTNTGDQTSIVGITGTKAQFDTACTDGNFLYVGDVTQYTDEMAQDAVGAMVDSTLVYTDATPLLSRAALTGDITASAGSNATTLATVNANVGSFTNASVTVNAKGLITAASSGASPATASFTTIAVSGQSDVVADSTADTLTLVAGSNITITTNAGTDSITIAASGGGGGITTGLALAFSLRMPMA